VSRIFISYRREDTLPYADRLQEDLSEHYGADEIFRDMDAIEPGIDFVQAIDRALSRTEIMLVLIGPTWLGPEGSRRLHEEGDYVRIEIATGLRRENVRVIPLLVGGAKMPAGEELPEDLRPLSRRNAFEIRNTSWRADRAELLRRLDKRPRGRLNWPELWRRWRTPAIVAAGVVAAGVAAVLLVVLLRDDPAPAPDPGEAAPPAQTETTPTQGETETAPGPPVEPGALEWTSSAAAVLGAEGEQRMNAVVNPIEGSVPAYVAVGFEGAAGARDGAIWTSPDGDAWTRVNADLRASGDQVMTSVAYHQGWATLFAGGTTEAGGDTDAALWQSKNGRRWSAVPGLRDPGSQEQVNAVNGTRLGLTAAGSRRGGGTQGEDGAIWIYAQGGEPFIVTEGLGGRCDQRVNRVVQLEDESFVAVGLDAGDAGVWTSDDGMSWDASGANPLEAEGEVEEMLDAAVSGSGIVAVGRAGRAGAAWHSPNGGNWRRVPNLGGVFAAPEGVVELLRVFASEDAEVPRFLAGGRAGPAAAVWVSSDGRRWTREPDSEGALGAQESVVEGLTAKSLPAVAVGWSGGDAAVWLGESPKP
jgi:TIR domain